MELSLCICWAKMSEELWGAIVFHKNTTRKYDWEGFFLFIFLEDEFCLGE